MYPCLGLNVTAVLFSQPGTAIHSRVEGSCTAYLWRRNRDANLKDVIYPGWNSEIIIPSVCTHVWQPFSQCLLPLCYGGRGLIAETCEVLAGQLQKHLWVHCLPASAAFCTRALQLLHHLIAWSYWEIHAQTYFEVAIPQKILCSVSKLAV